MAFHLGFELPAPCPTTFDAESETLTEWELEVIKKQIRKNSEVIGTFIRRIDLFVNKEKYPKKEFFIQKIRDRMSLLMEENDTFRRLLWRHLQGKVEPIRQVV